MHFGELEQVGAQRGALEDVDMGDLMDLNEGVNTKTPLSAREYPGTITILNRDEILRSGARDLLDLLQRIPGVDAGVDRRGALGLTVRGQWAGNGRVLLLLDGQPLTENLFGSTPLGGRFELGMIQRIEVIRAPHPADYGL